MSVLCSNLELLDTALCDYLSFKEIATQPSWGLADEIVNGWLTRRQQLDEANAQTGDGFNPLELIPLKETTHSRILGEMLDPKGSHGQKSLFLGCFLRLLGVPRAAQDDKWRITVEKSRVDIMLIHDQPRSAILIENKSNDAWDQPNQIYRYWHQHVYLVDPSLNYQDPDVRQRFRIIYLPTDGSKTPASHSLQRPEGWKSLNPAEVIPLQCETIAFPELLALFHREARTSIPATNVRLLAFLDFYHDYWRTV